jgi:hypothetical protein
VDALSRLSHSNFNQQCEQFANSTKACNTCEDEDDHLAKPIKIKTSPYFTHITMDLEEDQLGGDGVNFSIQRINERHIAKFNVNGFDYKVKVEPLRYNATYQQVLQDLHNLLSGM